MLALAVFGWLACWLVVAVCKTPRNSVEVEISGEKSEATSFSDTFNVSIDFHCRQEEKKGELESKKF